MNTNTKLGLTYGTGRSVSVLAKKFGVSLRKGYRGRLVLKVDVNGRWLIAGVGGSK